MYEKRIEDDHHWIKLRSNEVFNEKENRRVYLAIMLRTLVERVLPRVTLFEWDKMMTDQSIIQMRISKSNGTKTSLSRPSFIPNLTCVFNSLLANICGIKSKQICIDGTLYINGLI